jgi:formamidopyrimidine-DNA glycosylase
MVIPCLPYLPRVPRSLLLTMPELPEVEMVARHLHALVGGRRIVRARLLRERLAPELTPQQFARRLRGAQVLDVGRRGKHILARLDNGRTLITHLRMSGRFLCVDPDSEPAPHTHASFDLDDGRRLLFTDQRHFAYMTIAESSRLGEVEALRRLGPEPFDPAFTPEVLRAALARSRQPIKIALLDQTRVVGLGNIYAAEALHRARISPKMPAAGLSPDRARALHGEIIAVLSEAIESASRLALDLGSLDETYLGGEFEKDWLVYDREGRMCRNCATPIRRIIQGGRSTYYCPRCQSR